MGNHGLMWKMAYLKSNYSWRHDFVDNRDLTKHREGGKVWKKPAIAKYRASGISRSNTWFNFLVAVLPAVRSQIFWHAKYAYIYIYTYLLYIYMEPVCPSFWGVEAFRQRPKLHSKQGFFGFQVHNIVGLSPLTQGCQLPTSIFTYLGLGIPSNLNLRYYWTWDFGVFFPRKSNMAMENPLFENVYFYK